MKNYVDLIGRIASDIETRSTQGGTDITNFTLVTSSPVLKDGKPVKKENGYNETYDEFHRITVFNGLGKTLAKHKKKGDVLNVMGRIHYTKWQDQQGNDRYGCEIIANEVLFL
jgi:single-strand DNA-binding protein